LFVCNYSKTFIYVTGGFTFASFVLGGLSWWLPLYVEYAIYSKDQQPEQLLFYKKKLSKKF